MAGDDGERERLIQGILLGILIYLGMAQRGEEIDGCEHGWEIHVDENPWYFILSGAHGFSTGGGIDAFPCDGRYLYLYQCPGRPECRMESFLRGGHAGEERGGPGHRPRHRERHQVQLEQAGRGVPLPGIPHRPCIALGDAGAAGARGRSRREAAHTSWPVRARKVPPRPKGRTRREGGQ